MTRRFAFLALLALTACGKGQQPAGPAVAGRWQMVATQDGEGVWRLDSATGALDHCYMGITRPGVVQCSQPARPDAGK